MQDRSHCQRFHGWIMIQWPSGITVTKTPTFSPAVSHHSLTVDTRCSTFLWSFSPFGVVFVDITLFLVSFSFIFVYVDVFCCFLHFMVTFLSSRCWFWFSGVLKSVFAIFFADFHDFWSFWVFFFNQFSVLSVTVWKHLFDISELISCGLLSICGCFTVGGFFNGL